MKKTGLKWSKVRAGHYYTRRWNSTDQAMDQVHVFNYAPRDWELTINGQHKGYGTKGELQTIAAQILGV